MKTSMKTLVIGAAIVDLMMHIDRLPKSGEDIPCHDTRTVVGGCAYNVANTLQNLHIPHDLCVPVGPGHFGDIIRAGMLKSGYTPLIEDSTQDNGYCLSLIEQTGERTFITVQGSEGHFKSEWFDQIDINNYYNIYIAGYQSCGESGQVISHWLAQNPTISNKRIFFAPGPMITHIEPDILERLLSLQPILHLNEVEALDFTKCTNTESAIKTIYNKNKNLVFITLGKRGTLYYDGNEIHTIDAMPTTVVDTVGAGDSHIAAIIAGISNGLSISQSVHLANKVAASIVSISGPVMDYEAFQKNLDIWNYEYN